MDYPNNLSPRCRKMYALIEKSQNSPLSQKVFCQQEDLALSTFTYWLKKYRRSQQTADFIPMKINERSSQKQSEWCEIEFPGGIMIRIGGL